MPGVTYSKRVQFTPHGPVVLNVITAPKPGGLYSLQPVLSNESIVGREKVTSMQKRLRATATVAGVNGDLFNWNDGHPSGVLIRNGVLEHPPLAERTSVGIASDGTLHPDRVSLLGYWQGTGSRLRIGLNDPPGENGFALFTPAYGATTPAESGAAEVVLHPFPNVTANTDLVGTVADVISPSGGKTAIPADGAVLQARGSGAFRLVGDAPLGSTLTIRYTLNPTWDGIVGAIGGGPVLVKDGKPIFRANEAVHDVAAFAARPAHGGRPARRREDPPGRRRRTPARVQRRRHELRARARDDAARLRLRVRSRRRRLDDDGVRRPVAQPALRQGWRTLRRGRAARRVHRRLRPAGIRTGALAERRRRRRVREPCLQGRSSEHRAGEPRRPRRRHAADRRGTRAPGTYKFNWTGRGQPEGSWKFSVTATDDLAQISTAERTFSLNNTLASLAVKPKALKLRKKRTRLVASFKLARAAKVTATVETANGTVVRVLARRSAGAGAQRLQWNGRGGSGGLAYGGSYRLHVSATNSVGRVDLYAPFSGAPVVSAAVLLASLTSSLTSFVRDNGLYAVFLLMLVDAVFPAASELVMVVGGALAAGAFGATVTLFGAEIPQGFWSFVAIALAGTLGYLVGAIIGWWIGIAGGRPLLERHGRWFHLTPEQLGRAERWFDRYEDWAVFLGRITPRRALVRLDSGRRLPRAARRATPC